MSKWGGEAAGFHRLRHAMMLGLSHDKMNMKPSDSLLLLGH